MRDDAALLSLFQLTDSFFPSGAFAHSWGLETFVCNGLVGDVGSLEDFLSACLRGQVARSEALVVKLAFEAALRSDLSACVRLDKRLYAMKTARECREGGRQIGRQVLRVVNTLRQGAVLGEFARIVEAGKAWGNHATVFGLVCHAMGISRQEAVQAFLYQTACGIVSAGVRLVPLGHMDGQRALEWTKPVMVEIAEEIGPLGEDAISTFAPGVEIRAMQHQFLYTRLFRS